MPNPCQPLISEVEGLKTGIASLQAELHTVAGTQKAAIIKLIKELRGQLQQKSRALETCKKNYIEPNVYKCNDGGLYYFREIGTNLYWFGENKNGSFANIFVGDRTGNTATGRWFDLPKGKENDSGQITLTFDPARKTWSRVQSSGGFSGSFWEPHKPLIEPGLRAGVRFQKAGFQSAGNLTGTWVSDKNTYYLRQIGDEVFGVGEGNNFSVILNGTRTNDLITFNWVSTPKAGESQSNGTVTLDFNGAYWHLSPTAQTGGFADTLLHKVAAVNCEVNLNKFSTLDHDEVFGDEPFLWLCLLKVDGDTVSLENLSNARPSILCRGEHGNVPDSGDLPATLGQFKTTVKTLRGMDPAGDTALDSTKFALIVLAWENDHTSDSAINSGRRAFEETLDTELSSVIRRLNSDIDFDALQEKLNDAVEGAIREGTSIISLGALDPDDFIGVDKRVMSFRQLEAQAAANEQVSMEFNMIKCVFVLQNPFNPTTIFRDSRCTGSFPDNGSVFVSVYYRVTGTLRVS